MNLNRHFGVAVAVGASASHTGRPKKSGPAHECFSAQTPAARGAHRKGSTGQFWVIPRLPQTRPCRNCARHTLSPLMTSLCLGIMLLLTLLISLALRRYIRNQTSLANNRLQSVSLQKRKRRQRLSRGIH
ncbi:hypothetical protein BDW72DRAFT_68125 [Aspergillus terricola var. indicus]